MLLNRDTVQWKKRREEKNGELLLKALKMTVWQCSIHSQILRSFSKKKKKKAKTGTIQMFSKNWTEILHHPGAPHLLYLCQHSLP